MLLGVEVLILPRGLSVHSGHDGHQRRLHLPYPAVTSAAIHHLGSRPVGPRIRVHTALPGPTHSRPFPVLLRFRHCRIGPEQGRIWKGVLQEAFPQDPPALRPGSLAVLDPANHLGNAVRDKGLRVVLDRMDESRQLQLVHLRHPGPVSDRRGGLAPERAFQVVGILYRRRSHAWPPCAVAAALSFQSAGALVVRYARRFPGRNLVFDDPARTTEEPQPFTLVFHRCLLRRSLTLAAVCGHRHLWMLLHPLRMGHRRRF